MKNRSGKQLTLQQMQDPHFFDKTFEARRTIKLKKKKSPPKSQEAQLIDMEKGDWLVLARTNYL